MKKYYVNGLFLLMISALVFGCAAPQVQTTQSVFSPVTLAADQYEPKVDNFVVILDTSYSMNHKYGEKKKVEIAKEFLTAMQLQGSDQP